MAGKYESSAARHCAGGAQIAMCCCEKETVKKANLLCAKILAWADLNRLKIKKTTVFRKKYGGFVQHRNGIDAMVLLLAVFKMKSQIFMGIS